MRSICTPIALLLLACGTDPSARPGTVGTRGGDFFGGGGGDRERSDADAGPPRGVGEVTGFVRRLADLTRTADRGAPVAGATVSGTSPEGDVVTTSSGLDGAFGLAGIDLDPTALCEVDSEPPSRVIVEAARATDAVLPVVDAVFLEDVAASVGVAVEGLSGHAFVWMRDDRGFPIDGLSVTVTSVSPVRGPFFEAGDPVLLSESGPTGPSGLVVLMAGLPDDYSLDVFRAGEPDSSASLTIEIVAGAVTFYEATVRL